MKVLEFYSGIGGMQFALQMAGVTHEVVAAFEINTTANAVYKYNFPNTALMQKNIEGLVVQDFRTKFKADVWTMSPPCQPYTRQGKQKASNDPRAKSFLNLLNILSDMAEPPMYILIENVKGFEVSDTRNLLIDVLKARDYVFQEFLLSPNDFGVPNSRMRYYLIAKRINQFAFRTTEKPLRVSYDKIDENIVQYHDKRVCVDKQCACEYVTNQRTNTDQRNVEAFLDDETDVRKYSLNRDTLLRYYKILDIIKPGSDHSCCFTKAYGKYAEGTGSVLTTVSDENFQRVNQLLQNETDEEVRYQLLSSLNLRYFSPGEVANLMCFPDSFVFPDETTLKQKYRLLGNSINVFVVSVIMKWMFAC